MFVTTPTMSGVEEDTGQSYCALQTTKTKDSTFDCMNAAGPKEDYSVNLWYEAYSEDANEWSFAFEQDKSIITGIDRIDVDGSEDSNEVHQAATDQIFDIYGRHVSDLVPGQLYIYRSGKFIAR